MKGKMDLKSLKSLKKTELVVIARKNGIKNASGIRKDELIQAILTSTASVPKKKFANSVPKGGIKKAANKLSKKVQSPPVTGIDQSIHDSSNAVQSTVVECDPVQDQQAECHETYELPYSYDITKLVAMVRDPYWVYVYWDLDPGMNQEIVKRFNLQGDSLRVIIRMHDVTDLNFDGFNSHNQVDVDIDLAARSWCMYIGEPKRSFVFDLGLIDSDGNFFLIARSNVVCTPNDGPSEVVDNKWISYDFEEIYLASGGRCIGLSSGELRKKKQVLMEKGWVSSGMMSSPSKKDHPGRDFFLEVGTEFVLYGRTKPDAILTVEGERIPLREDGTFTLRYSLPDSHRTLPVKAVSSDKVDSRTITVEIKKDTK